MENHRLLLWANYISILSTGHQISAQVETESKLTKATDGQAGVCQPSPHPESTNLQFGGLEPMWSLPHPFSASARAREQGLLASVTEESDSLGVTRGPGHCSHLYRSQHCCLHLSTRTVMQPVFTIVFILQN